MDTLQLVVHYLQSSLQTSIQSVALQAPVNHLPKKNTRGQLKKKEGDRLRQKRKREEAATGLVENEALKIAIKTKDEVMAALHEEIAVLKQQIAVDGNARANRAENMKIKRDEAERIAADPD